MANIAVPKANANGTIIKAHAAPGAIPRPPLNPVKMGQLCPITTSKPAATSNEISVYVAFARETARSPFPTSRRNTIMASFGPEVLSTFVVPIPPLPI